MSYDLFFKTEATGKAVSHEAFDAYFASRKHYKVDTQQASYNNDDTGVYFDFYFGHTELGLDMYEFENKDGLESLYFRLNLIRPHVFAWEAEPEVQAFCDHFVLLVVDPQTESEKPRLFYGPEFIAQYRRSNRNAYKALRDSPEMKSTLMPGEILPARCIEDIWRWNVDREQLYESLGLDIHIPHILLLRVGDDVRTAVVWTDAMPVAIPEVDLVFVYRERLAPRRWFRSEKEGYVLRPFSELLPLLERYPIKSRNLRYRELYYSDAPPDLVRYFKRVDTPISTSVSLVPFDQVIADEDV